MMALSTHLEKLKEEIDAKKRVIQSIPNPADSNLEAICFLAKHQQILGEKEEEYDLILEKQRRRAVVDEHAKLHPPITEECPICLESINVSKTTAITYSACCGNGCCVKCFEDVKCHGDLKMMTSCPLCRETYPWSFDTAKETRLVKKLADGGRSWAQHRLASNYFGHYDDFGFTIDKKKALKWLKLAAHQRFPPSLHQLGGYYLEGLWLLP